MVKCKENTAEAQKNILLQDIKPFQELNLSDDFMFDAATNDLECCRIILELSLGIQINSIRWKENQKVIHNLPGRRGIRLDFYVETANGKIYDVEMQKRNTGHIPKRTRFYQSLIDAPLLKSGEESFDNLKPSCIVVICQFDLFGLGKYRYTFTNRCKEVPALELEDESTKIILSTKGKNDSEVEKSLVDFLHYVESSNSKNISENCDERLKHLHKVLQAIKANSKMEAVYMKAETRERLIIADAKAEAIEKTTTLLNLLIQKLIEDERMEDLIRSTKDRSFQEELLEEYGLQ